MWEDIKVFKQLWDSASWKAKVFWGLVVAPTVLRIALFLSIPIEALGNAIHDDRLQMNQACYLFQGNWLGAYSNTTLVKGISFPLFLAVCKWLCLPYGVGLSLFYILSIILCLVAIRQLFKNHYIVGIVYLFLLYSPAMLSSSTQQRAYNISLIPSAVLLVTGSCMALFLRREQGWKKLLPWSVLAGLSLAFFWYIRQDSMWLLPFVLGAIGIAVICILLKKVGKGWKVSTCVVLLLPFAVFEGISLGISAVNYHYYGVFTTNERTDSSCADVMADLIQMDMPKVREDVWVSHDTVERAMELSPTFGKIKVSVDKIYDSAWAPDGEIIGDLVVWALRDAVADAGYYTDGKTAEDFYRQVHLELEEAYKSGACTKKKGIFLSSLSDQFLFEEDFVPLLKTSLTAWRRLLFIEETNVGTYEGTGTAEDIRFFEANVGSPVIYPEGTGFDSDPVREAAQRPIKVGNLLINTYRLLTYLLVPLSVICYIWMTVSMVGEMKKKKYGTWYRWLIVTGLGGVSAVLIVEVSWFTSFISTAQHSIYHYCTGAHTLFQLIQLLTILWGVERLKERGQRQQNSD